MNGYPRLYIGKAAQELKKRVQFPVYQITKETLTEFISYYSTIPSMKFPLVIEDLAYLPFDSQSNLLKFIEDSKLNIILLSSEDQILSTILSRMSLVYKIKEQVTSVFNTPRQAQEELDKIDTDTYYLTYVKKQMQLSPISYYYDQYIGNKPNKQKLLQLISD
jgi:hypothetical protein